MDLSTIMERHLSTICEYDDDDAYANAMLMVHFYSVLMLEEWVMMVGSMEVEVAKQSR